MYISPSDGCIREFIWRTCTYSHRSLVHRIGIHQSNSTIPDPVLTIVPLLHDVKMPTKSGEKYPYVLNKAANKDKTDITL